MKPGVVPYSVIAELWSDGAHKERFLALPAGETINPVRNRGWNFPDKTVLVKSFALEMVRRVTHPAASGSKRASSPGNPASGTATPTSGTKRVPMRRSWTRRDWIAITPSAPRRDQRKQKWHFPSRAECMVCHSRAANFVLGLCEVQMNRDHQYPNGRTDNQLRVLEHLGMLKVDWYAEVRGGVTDKINVPQSGQRSAKSGGMLHQPPDGLKRLVDPYDAKADLDLRARSYLHANCSSCHVEAGGGNASHRPRVRHGTRQDAPLRGETPASDLRPGERGLVVPGHPERSVLAHRIGMIGPGRMPPLATNRVDERGLRIASRLDPRHEVMGRDGLSPSGHWVGWQVAVGRARFAQAR